MTPAQSRQVSECLHYLRLATHAELSKTIEWLRVEKGYAEAAIQAAIKEMSKLPTRSYR